MKISSLRLLAALLALMFVTAACASDTAVQWTFAPVASSETATSSEAGPTDPTTAPVTDAVPAASAEPAGTSAAPAGNAGAPAGTVDEPRIIMLQLTGALQITDASGNRVEDIPVTPGETITFQVTNVAGFDHNFYIGTEADVSAAGATTADGIPTWSTGTQELTWTVPEDVVGLQFACTVPGHYTLMHGTFSIAAGPTGTTATTEPSASGMTTDATTPNESAEPAGSMAPAGSSATGEPRVIELEATSSLQFTQDGSQIQDIPLTPGETVVFRIDNTAGFDHNFYIGTDAELSAPSAVTEAGIATWSSGVQEMTWTVPDDLEGLKFGCTVPGHYALMQGTFSVAADAGEPGGSVEPAASVESVTPAETAAAGTAADPGAGSATTADKRVITLEATAALQFTQDGVQITDIPVTPGETVVIRVDNTAGFSHNLYIGTDAELSAPGATTAVGIPDWESGVQFVDWEVPADITGLKFGCTVPGHYTLMQGTISVAP